MYPGNCHLENCYICSREYYVYKAFNKISYHLSGIFMYLLIKLPSDDNNFGS